MSRRVELIERQRRRGLLDVGNAIPREQAAVGDDAASAPPSIKEMEAGLPVNG